MRHTIRCVLFIGFALVPAAAARADQDEAAPQRVPFIEVISDRTTAAPLVPSADLPSAELELRIRPLRKADLEKAAEAWLGLLESTVSELAATEIAARSAEGEARDVARRAVVSLRGRRAAIAERASVVIDELEAKGGSVDEQRRYVRTVTRTSLEASDVGVMWLSLRAWITSKDGGVRWAGNIAGFVITLLAFWLLARALAQIVKRGLERLRRAPALVREAMANLVGKAVLVLGLVVAVSMLGVKVGPMLAALGVAGLVIGLALQDTLANFLSGLMILLYRPFDVGDAVSVAGASGTVRMVTLVSTTITTFDNQQIIIPNKSIWGSVITNMTGNPTRRVDMVFGISYADDIEKAQRILSDIVTTHAKVLADPAPVIRLHDLADSSVRFVVRPWVHTPDYWEVYWDVTRTVKQRFAAEGITIPFPQREVHLRQAQA